MLLSVNWQYVNHTISIEKGGALWCQVREVFCESWKRGKEGGVWQLDGVEVSVMWRFFNSCQCLPIHTSWVVEEQSRASKLYTIKWLWIHYWNEASSEYFIISLLPILSDLSMRLQVTNLTESLVFSTTTVAAFLIFVLSSCTRNWSYPKSYKLFWTSYMSL